MELIGNYWWLWLIGFVFCGALAVCNQICRMKRVLLDSEDFEDARYNFASGLWLLAIAVMCTFGFGLLLAVSIIVNLGVYLKG